METAKITATKVAANPQDHAWAQAYSTVKLYIVLSVEDTSQKSVAATGKEILEKLQREFFAVDEKSLETIKESVVNVTKVIDSTVAISLSLGTVVEGVLYLILVGNGTVIMHRNGKSGIVAKGEGKEPIAFSGKLETGDNIALATQEFLDKVPIEKITNAFSEDDLATATESIVPLIHADSSGKEAAILLHYIDRPKIEEDALLQEDKISEEEQDVVMGRASALSMLPHFHLPSLKGFLSPTLLHDRKKLMIIVAVFLVVILAGSLLFDRFNSQNKSRQETYAQIIDPLQKKYDDAISIANLNNTLALDELTQIRDEINNQKSKLPVDSTEARKLKEFETMVNNKIMALGGNASGGTDLAVFFDSSKNTDLGTIVSVTYKSGALTGVGQAGKVGTITNNSVSRTFNTKASDAKKITADNIDLFVQGDAIYKQPQNGENATKIIDSSSGILAIDTFGGNVYALTSDGIDKFAGASWAKSSYLKDNAKLSGTPSDMSIDSSIWVISKNGAVQKFTRGAQDSFSVNNLSKPFGQNPKIYTDIDYTNIYVLDSANGRVVTISKSGDVGKEYKAKGMARATSFAVDEPGKKLYILSSGKVYSLNL